MAKIDRKGRTKGATQPFVQVIKSTLKEPAWKALPYGARCLYITLKSFHIGNNNGRIYLSVRKAAEELGASKSAVEGWFQELKEKGFIRPTQGGFLGASGKGSATYWRLTELGCEGDQPTREYKAWATKNKSPSRKSGYPVLRIETPCPANRDSCPESRDDFNPNPPPTCPEKRDVSTTPSPYANLNPDYSSGYRRNGAGLIDEAAARREREAASMRLRAVLKDAGRTVAVAAWNMMALYCAFVIAEVNTDDKPTMPVDRLTCPPDWLR